MLKYSEGCICEITCELLDVSFWIWIYKAKVVEAFFLLGTSYYFLKIATKYAVVLTIAFITVWFLKTIEASKNQTLFTNYFY